MVSQMTEMKTLLAINYLRKGYRNLTLDTFDKINNKIKLVNIKKLMILQLQFMTENGNISYILREAQTRQANVPDEAYDEDEDEDDQDGAANDAEKEGHGAVRRSNGRSCARTRPRRRQ